MSSESDVCELNGQDECDLTRSKMTSHPKCFDFNLCEFRLKFVIINLVIRLFDIQLRKCSCTFEVW